MGQFYKVIYENDLYYECYEYDSTQQFLHVLSAQRTVSLRRFFWVPTTYVSIDK